MPGDQYANPCSLTQSETQPDRKNVQRTVNKKAFREAQIVRLAKGSPPGVHNGDVNNRINF